MKTEGRNAVLELLKTNKNIDKILINIKAIIFGIGKNNIEKELAINIKYKTCLKLK